MKIQLSDKRIIKDAVTVWMHPGPEVDVVMDLKNLTYRPGSVDEIYAFHVIDHMFPEEIIPMLINWTSLLKTPGSLHLLNDNFEYLARAFVGGDIGIELFNDLHNHPCQCTQEYLTELLRKSGFKDDQIVVWYGGVPSEEIKKNHYEFLLTAKKI